ncbi:MAG: GHKL domain-containing protein [Bacteroidetes bacterium]|nr:GHKL domain-containing protein [Bacteroidota bacterium]
MGFNRYVLNIVIRSVLLAATALLMAFLAFKPDWFFTFLFIGILFILQIVLLTRYASKVNRFLSNFLIHLKEENTSLNLTNNSIDQLFGGLTNELKNINEEFKRIESEITKEQNLLQLVLNQVGTGILLIDNENRIRIANKALHSIFGLSNINSAVLQKEILPAFKNIGTIRPGEQSIEILRINNLTRKILVSLSEIKEHKNYLRLYTFHDIDREITDYELQSWSGLIKVLSHEIMNTVTPVSTVTDTIRDCLTIENRSKELSEINEKDLADSIKGVTLIENRIKNLSDVIDKLRQFSDITNPSTEKIAIYPFLKDIVDIYTVHHPKVKFELVINNHNLMFEFDSKLIELAVNNIIKNSIEATLSQKRPHITIRAYSLKKQVIIECVDNGTGIDQSIQKKIFLPFYTTKEHGSGIGLSLAQHIMYAHKGNVEISSEPGKTTLKLIFKLVK